MSTFGQKRMKRLRPYWEGWDDWDDRSFFIKPLEAKSPLKAAEVPLMSIPLCGFLFLLEGEVLAEVDGEPCLCRGGQFLLLPEGMPFSVHHYSGIVGYTGCFSLQFVSNASYSCLAARRPVLHTFWFDEAAFMAEMLDRVNAAFARGDEGYITRALDLILYSLQTPRDRTAHPLVSRFMGMLFDRSSTLDSVSGYAARLGITPSYLNKMVRTQTRHSAMDWVEIARVNWAKTLLKDRTVPVSDVSLSVGIDDPSYFTRFFRKATGMTPSEFRRQMERTGDKSF